MSPAAKIIAAGFAILFVAISASMTDQDNMETLQHIFNIIINLLSILLLIITSLLQVMVAFLNIVVILLYTVLKITLGGVKLVLNLLVALINCITDIDGALLYDTVLAWTKAGISKLQSLFLYVKNNSNTIADYAAEQCANAWDFLRLACETITKCIHIVLENAFNIVSVLWQAAQRSFESFGKTDFGNVKDAFFHSINLIKVKLQYLYGQVPKHLSNAMNDPNFVSKVAVSVGIAFAVLIIIYIISSLFSMLDSGDHDVINIHQRTQPAVDEELYSDDDDGDDNPHHHDDEHNTSNRGDDSLISDDEDVPHDNSNQPQGVDTGPSTPRQTQAPHGNTAVRPPLPVLRLPASFASPSTPQSDSVSHDPSGFISSDEDVETEDEADVSNVARSNTVYLCSVCTEGQQEIQLLPCGHKFCEPCVRSFRSDKQCPNCSLQFSEWRRIRRQ